MRCDRRSNRKTRFTRTHALHYRHLFCSQLSSVKHHALRWLLSLTFFVTFLLLTTTASAQTDERPPAYWQYDAVGKVDDVSLADIDKDGFTEFLILSNNQLTLLRGNGESLWTYEMASPNLHATGIAVSAELPLNVAIASEDALMLLSNTGQELWVEPREFDAPSVSVTGLDADNDGNDEILLLTQSGAVQLIDQNARLLWEFPGSDDPTHDAQPRLFVSDLERNGRDDIVLGYFDPQGFSRLVRLADDGKTVWERIIEGRINALQPVEFDLEQPVEIGVGTSRGRVHLFSPGGSDRWPRTLNAAVTGMTLASWPGTVGRVLAVSTNQGRLVVYDRDGQRIWDKLVCSVEESRIIDSAEYDSTRCASGPDSRIEAISAAPLDQTNPAVNLVITYTTDNATSSDVANILLVNNNGRVLTEFVSNSPPGLSRLLDLNHDTSNELLLTSFSTTELLSPVTTLRQNVENVEEWPFRLRGRPSAAIAIDVEGDRQNELFIGTSDGRLLRLRENGVADWVTTLDGAVVDLQLLTSEQDEGSVMHILAATNSQSPRDETQQGHLDLFGLDTEPVWLETFDLDGGLTALTIDDSDPTQPLIISATDQGQIIALDATGTVQWEQLLAEPATHLAVLIAAESNGDQIVASHGSGFIAFDRDGNQRLALDVDPDISAETSAADICTSTSQLLQLLADGVLSDSVCLDQPLSTWEQLLGRSRGPISIQTENTVYIPSGLGQWQQSELLGSNLNRVLAEYDDITSVYVGDLTDDGLDDVALGSSAGLIYLDLSDGSQSTIQLTSPVLHITGISGTNIQPGLLVTTENGLVSLFRFQPNHPPLVTALGIENDENNNYNLGMAILDAEGDAVEVELELYNPESDTWTELQPAQSSEASIFWSIAPPQQDDVTYRVNYSEGSHQGTIAPGISLAAVPVEGSPTFPRVWLWLLVPLFAVVGVIGWRMTRSPQAKVRRFYHRLDQNRSQSLPVIEAEYNRTAGSPDFLLSLASTARNQGDQMIAGIADGLFLLANRPNAAVSIINTTLSTIAGRSPVSWQQFDLWRTLFRTVNKMLSPTSITNLVFLRPRLLELIEQFELAERHNTPFDSLLPIMNSMRDSDRVELADDRLVYLNEAIVMLRRLNIRMADWAPTMENRLLKPIVNRWMGLVTAEIESVRGHARIWVTLKTTNIAPSAETVLALEVKNIGRAPAEELLVRLEEQAYCINSNEQGVPFLAPGRSKEVRFDVRPPEEEQFRVSFQIEYSDRNERHRLFEYANVVNVLRPVHNFEPILNPYAPGTPLRKNSDLFFGRTDLFQFIAEEAGRLAQQSVLILVGQRRTGKTSALLRLDHYLSSNLLPVYVDCQSLGIIPGMAAFFHDIAWLVVDTLETRGISLEVPEIEDIAAKPAHWFQREFIPQALTLLPDDMTLVLAFDEFEALENLVNDGILPQTFFTYLRHMMQHGKGLSFIFAGTHRLEEMTSDYWSVLFNIALYKEVGYLSREAANQLIAEPVAPHIVYDDLALDKLWRMSAGHPYFLQLVCYTLVKRANQERTGYVTISDVNAAIDEMIQLGEVHFAYLWQHSTKNERLVLTAMAHLIENDTPVRSAEIVQVLIPYGITLEPAQVTTALNRLVRRSLLRTITDGPTLMYEARIGLIFSWVEQTKGLNQLYESWHQLY